MNTYAPIYRVCGIVPAAGLGRRMGQPKQTLPVRGSTMVGGVVRTLLDAGLDEVVVVTRSALVERLDLPTDRRLSVAVNDDESSQMIHSVRDGLSVLFHAATAPNEAGEVHAGPVDRAADRTGILVMPADMPGVAVATCRLCVEAYRREPTKIIVAAHKGRRGHPLIFPAALRQVVHELDGGLNALLDLSRNRVRLVEAGDPATLEDVDTWDQYRSLSRVPPENVVLPANIQGGFMVDGNKQQTETQHEVSKPDITSTRQPDGCFTFPTGSLTLDQLQGVFAKLPVEITFVDEEDRVRFFTRGDDRIFGRTTAVLGKKVQQCHPEKSIGAVNQILSDFRSGRQNLAQFWLNLRGRFVHVQYHAVRNASNTYIGTLEVTQDLTVLRALQGERRLLQYDNTKEGQ